MELKFKNNSIEKYKSNAKDFFDKSGNSEKIREGTVILILGEG